MLGRVLAVLLLTASCWLLPAQSGSVSDPNLELLPAGLRDQGRAALQEGDESRRLAAVVTLARTPSVTLPFLLRILESDASSRIRSAVIERIGRLHDPQVREALRRRVVSDPDTGVALLALERFQGGQTRESLRLLEQRLETARQSGARGDFLRLTAEHERLANAARGARLPAFLLDPPPLFSLKAAGETIRVLAFGDYGQGTDFQRQTAAAMLRYHRQHPFDFGITLGDNFYPRGMTSPQDPRWKTWWSDLYDPLGIRFYATLGNHDWGFADSPAAEVIYSSSSPSWRMPATRYTFTAGPVQFFATDTFTMEPAQLLWLKKELEQSTARWKIVYGHHPIYSAGVHGDIRTNVTDLLPVLKGRADAFLAGHDHDMQHLQPEGGVHFFVAGVGGAGIRPITAGPRSLFTKSSYGFAVLDADNDGFKVSFVDRDLNTLYEYTIRK
jgi:tartrate-resistant acid phosphatase type 5